MIFKKTIELLGIDQFNKIQNKTVLVFGLGGVGGHATEALARTGIGNLILVDLDKVDPTNINRQIIALHSTIDMPKTEVMKNRLKDINPDLKITTYSMFYNFETKDKIWDHDIDYVIDCIDTVTFKIDIIKTCLDKNIPFISVMGSGNKMMPEKLDIMPLSKTSYDPIARVLRTKLKKHPKYKEINVVASKEMPNKDETSKRSPASNAFVPATAGLIAASYIIRKIIETT